MVWVGRDLKDHLVPPPLRCFMPGSCYEGRKMGWKQNSVCPWCVLLLCLPHMAINQQSPKWSGNSIFQAGGFSPCSLLCNGQKQPLLEKIQRWWMSPVAPAGSSVLTFHVLAVAQLFHLPPVRFPCSDGVDAAAGMPPLWGFTSLLCRTRWALIFSLSPQVPDLMTLLSYSLPGCPLSAFYPWSFLDCSSPWLFLVSREPSLALPLQWFPSLSPCPAGSFEHAQGRGISSSSDVRVKQGELPPAGISSVNPAQQKEMIFLRIFFAVVVWGFFWAVNWHLNGRYEYRNYSSLKAAEKPQPSDQTSFCATAKLNPCDFHILQSTGWRPNRCHSYLSTGCQEQGRARKTRCPRVK